MTKEFAKRFLSSLVILPLSVIFIIYGSVFFLFFLSIIFFVTSYEWSEMNKKKNLNKFLGIFFLFYSCYSAFELRNFSGANFFFFILLICISTDLGGYVFGKIFKGPKVTKISPNKTYSGVVGSFLLPVMVVLIYAKFTTTPLNSIVSIKLSKIINNNELSLLFLILFISFISQIGDLIISYFKRLAKVKDTGKIIPGHGGILDRIDGLIFVIPILYLFTIL